MSTILDEIVINRRLEVNQQKELVSLSQLKSATDFNTPRNSLVRKLTASGSSGIIAEFKRRSPSKGVINDRVEPEIVTKGYADAGVSGLSVLTDGRYFGGTVADFISARNSNPLTPLLRKDFLVLMNHQ